MNKLLIAVALCAALTACKKEEAAPAADMTAPAAAETAAPADAAPAEPAATDAAPAASTLPQACEDYLTRAQACFDKASNNAAAAALKQAFDSTRASWESAPDKSVLADACKMANDQFAQTAATLKCE